MHLPLECFAPFEKKKTSHPVRNPEGLHLPLTKRFPEDNRNLPFDSLDTEKEYPSLDVITQPP